MRIMKVKLAHAIAMITLTTIFGQCLWAESGSMNPLEIPTDFNPATSMISRQEDNGTFHASRLGAEFAARLVENGAPEDIVLAENVLAAVKSCQELISDIRKIYTVPN